MRLEAWSRATGRAQFRLVQGRNTQREAVSWREKSIEDLKWISLAGSIPVSAATPPCPTAPSPVPPPQQEVRRKHKGAGGPIYPPSFRGLVGWSSLWVPWCWPLVSDSGVKQEVTSNIMIEWNGGLWWNSKQHLGNFASKKLMARRWRHCRMWEGTDKLKMGEQSSIMGSDLNGDTHVVGTKTQWNDNGSNWNSNSHYNNSDVIPASKQLIRIQNGNYHSLSPHVQRCTSNSGKDRNHKHPYWNTYMCYYCSSKIFN